VAPAMAVQLAPAASQLCHWCVTVAAEPENVAAVAVSTWPTAAVPVIAGSVAFAGATTTAGTTAVAAEVPVAVPALLVAVSTTRSVCPTSPATTAYVVPVWPATATQLAPAASHCCHARATIGAGSAVQRATGPTVPCVRSRRHVGSCMAPWVLARLMHRDSPKHSGSSSC